MLLDRHITAIPHGIPYNIVDVGCVREVLSVLRPFGNPDKNN
jgi:hypothetical protein